MAIAQLSDVASKQKLPKEGFCKHKLFRLPKAVKWQDARTKALSSKRSSLLASRIKRADLKGDSPNIRVCGAHFVTGRPASSHQKRTRPGANALLGYTRKSEGIARYERAARRRTKRPTPEVDAGTTAPSEIVDSPQRRLKTAATTVTTAHTQKTARHCCKLNVKSRLPKMNQVSLSITLF
ncbi:hypothetical protein HPB52_015312 [Rhipicephalus sanguineus]|uniref:THAP-type domain-containing protein n=1 Tax=Rhipicephalus sanguineus TaxID=34632 RepID=A0A9D4SQJ3_RHISA|nr:hypothetical protein HPB52_015312 [Rhipicephalus sanguineus]